MNDNEDEDKTIYKVVLNHEEQYSIWPKDRENPPGWRDEGVSGPKAECLNHIKDVWTDMRPLSLRKRMEEMARESAATPPAESSSEEAEPYEDLPTRLAKEESPVEMFLNPRGIKTFKECLDRKYVQVKFTATRGGTVLGFKLDEAKSMVPAEVLTKEVGTVRLVGELTLDYVKVLCRADIDVGSLSGKGKLEKLGS